MFLRLLIVLSFFLKPELPQANEFSCIELLGNLDEQVDLTPTNQFIEQLLETLTPEEIYYFVPKLNSSFPIETLFKKRKVTVDEMRKAAREIQFNLTSNHFYQEDVRRPVLSKALIKIAKSVEANTYMKNELDLSRLMEFAAYRMIALKREGKVGDLYEIWTNQTPLLSTLAPDVLVLKTDRATEAVIDEFFSGDNPMPLSNYEQSLIKKKFFTVEELTELASIRKAIYFIERNDDRLISRPTGSFLSNLKGELCGGGAFTCNLLAKTYESIIRRLINQKRVKHWFPAQTATRAWMPWFPGSAHVGLKLMSLEQGRYVVIDGWIVSGNHAPVVLKYDDWIEGREDNPIISLGAGVF